MSERPSERRALVTGGTGTLGRQVVAALDERAGVAAWIPCRRERPAHAPSAREWLRTDGYREACDTPNGARTPGRVRFVDCTRRRR